MSYKHPQTVIKNFNDNTCLFICYLYCMGLEPDTLADWMDHYKTALQKKCIDEEGFVLDAEKLLLYLTGKKWSVTKKEINTIKDIKERTPVFYSIDGKSGHFVVVEDGEIVFNPLEVSNNVKKGKPISARIIKLRSR